MRNIVLHIGYHKCASTFMQSNIFNKLPVNFRMKWGVNFKYKKREYLDFIESNKCDTSYFRDLMLENYGNTYKTTVISHEELSGHIKGYDEINEEVVARNLKKAFPNAKVIIIIRRQFDYIKSLYCYRTSVKGEEIRSFKKFCKDEGSRGLFDKLYYSHLVRLYFKLFGKDNVLVLPMEMLSIESEKFTRIIADFTCENNNFELSQPKGVKVNSSFDSLLVINVSRLLNCIFLVFYNCFKLVNRSVRYDMRVRYYFYKKKRAFSCKLANFRVWQTPIGIFLKQEIEEKYKGHNSRLEKLIGIDIKKYGYY